MNISDALDAAERSLAEGEGLHGTGFWKAVSACRRDPQLAETHADRIAAIDRRAFEDGVKLRVPAWAGLGGLALGTVLGSVVLAMAGRFDAPVREVVFLAGFGAVLVSSHSLTHWIVGRVVGMRFTHVFVGGPPPPRPGLKTDYATYLRTPPRRRAVMHASGAVVTKLIPFALIPVALALDLGTWVVVVLVAIGVVQIVTDVTLSTKVSDWKKVRRELEAARARR